MSKYDGSLKFDTSLDEKGFQQGVNKLNVAATAAVAAIGTAVAAGIATVIKYGSAVETGLAKVSTMVSGSAGECSAALDDISQSLLKTSGATGQATASLAEAAYQALSAGVEVSQAGAYIDKAAKLAIGGFTSTESAVDVLSSVINAYGNDVIDIDTASKILMQTQNKGKTTIDELSHSLAQCTPTAAAMGVSFEQVGAALATMTAQGTPTSQATTQLNQLMAELGKSGTVAAENLAAAAAGTEYAGKSFTDLMASGVPLSDILLLMSAHAQQNGTALLDMFGSIEAGKAALSIAAQDGTMYTQNLAAMGTKTDVVTAAYEKMMDTFDAKKDVFVESAKNVAIAAYTCIEEPLKKAADTGIKWVQKLGKYVQQNGDKIVAAAQKILEIVTEVAAAFVAYKTAMLIGSVISTVTSAISAATTALVAQKIAVNGATVAMQLLNTTLAANPFTLVALAIAAVVGAVVSMTLAMEDNQTAAERDLALAQEQHAAIQQQAADYDKLKAARFESAQADLIGIDYTKQLADELMHLADSSGYVQDADRDRANFLLGALNQALGTEYSMTGNVIDQYGKLTDSVYAVISAKRAEILLSAQEDAYREAILKREQAQSDAANAKIAMDQEQIAVDELTAQHIQELTDLETLRALGASASTTQQQSEGQIVMSGWYAELEARKATLAEQQAAYADASGTAKKYHDDIAAYQSAATLIAKGETDQAIADMERKNAAYLAQTDVIALSGEEQRQILGQQYANLLTQLNDNIANYKSGTEGYTLADVEALQASAAQCGAEAEKVGVAIVDGQITGIDGKKIPLETTIKSLGDNGIKVLGTFVPSFKEQGVFACQGYIDGVRSKKQAVYDVWAEVTSFGKQGVSDTQQSGSPAKKFIEQGEFGGQGYVVGLQREAPAASAAGAGLGTAALAGAAAFNASFVQRMRAQVQRTQESIAFNAAARNEAVYASAAAPPPAPATKAIQFGDVHLYASPGASESEMSRVLEDYETRSDWGIK